MPRIRGPARNTLPKNTMPHSCGMFLRLASRRATVFGATSCRRPKSKFVAKAWRFRRLGCDSWHSSPPPPPFINRTMAPPPRRTVQLEAKILGARGLVSLKGAEEPVTSSASLTLLGAEPVTSEEVAESSEPTYECSKNRARQGGRRDLRQHSRDAARRQHPRGRREPRLRHPLARAADAVGGHRRDVAAARRREGAAAGEVCVTVIAALPP